MKTKHLLSVSILLCLFCLPHLMKAQVPTADFTIAPTPFCSGAGNTYTITDLSTGAPTAWSYTIRAGGGPGPGAQPTISTLQNPTVSFNNQGTYSITLIASNATGSSIPIIKTITVLPGPNANINPANSTNCIGGNPSTINIVTGGPGNTALTYSWSTGASTSSISVSPTATTIYTCVISSTNGCSVTRTSTLTVANPTVSISSSPANICPGVTSTLSATSSGPGPYLFLWSDNSFLSTLTTSVAGVISVTVTNGQGCSGVQSYTLGTSTTLSLTAISTPSILCSGNTGTLSVSGAASYSWNTGSTAASTTINPTSNTTYSVQGSIGTCTGVTAITVSVSILPTVVVMSNPSPVCAGQSVTLTASGAAAYTWTPGGSNSSSLVVSPGSSTSYTARGQNPGCPARNGTLNLAVSPTPIISIITSGQGPVCSGEPLALSAFGANNYTWSTGASGAVIIVYPSANMVYSVNGVNTSNCVGTASTNITVMDCTGINEQFATSENIRVYPNPATHNLYLYSSRGMSLEIYSISGDCVKKLTLEAGISQTLNISEWSPGLYILKSGSGGLSKLLIE